MEGFSLAILWQNLKNSLLFSLLAGNSGGERFAADSIHRQLLLRILLTAVGFLQQIIQIRPGHSTIALGYPSR